MNTSKPQAKYVVCETSKVEEDSGVYVFQKPPFYPVRPCPECGNDNCLVETVVERNIRLAWLAVTEHPELGNKFLDIVRSVGTGSDWCGNMLFHGPHNIPGGSVPCTYRHQYQMDSAWTKAYDLWKKEKGQKSPADLYEESKKATVI